MVAVTACGAGPEQIPAVTGDMGCGEVAETVDVAITRAGRFVAQQETDSRLSADLVFALSGAEERPECISDAVRSRAAGLRATLVGTGG